MKTAPYIERGFRLVFIGGLHGLLLFMLATYAVRPRVPDDLRRVDVRLIEERPPIEPEKPRPVPPPPRPAAIPPPAPLPVLTAADDAPPGPAMFAVAPQPPLRAEPAREERPAAPAAAPPPLPVTPARFYADYLHNPPPAYPLSARRTGQQGRVMLRVRVSAQGDAKAVEIQSGSGHERLDQAAVDAVRQWRFVPAKRGTEPIEDWVVVPIDFRLD